MTPLRELFRTLHREEPAFSIAGRAQIGLLSLMPMAAPWDSRQMSGLDPWIKPMKFAGWLAIYLRSIGWFLRYLPGPAGFKRAMRYGVPSLMFGEIALIAVQGARGVRSHFNTDSSTDGLLFTLMGLLILLNTLIVLVMFFQYLWQEIRLEPAYLTGIRLGLALFIFGSLQGVVMLLNMGHTVGLADGGAGLPFLNWSTQGGDLRVAHAAGIHALQLLPLAGYAVSQWCAPWPRLAQLALMMTLGLAYLGAFSWLFRQAVAGHPLIAVQ